MLCSPNATKHDSQNEHKQGQSAEHIPGHKAKPFPRFPPAPLPYLTLHKIPSIYPEEHNACKTGAQGADIDGYKIHPVSHDPLDTDADEKSQGHYKGYGDPAA